MFFYYPAPSATAAIGISIPFVWSEYPTFNLNFFLIVLIALRFTSFLVLLFGIAMQNRNLFLLVPDFSKISKAFYFFNIDIPVDKITSYLMNLYILKGRFVISPDGIFIIFALNQLHF